MYSAKRPVTRPIFFLLLIIISFTLTACGDIIGSRNWPGLSANGSRVYVAYGPDVQVVDVVEQRQVWSFPVEANPAVGFYAAPAIAEDRVIIGDYGAPGGFFSPGVTVTIYALQDVENGIPNVIWSAPGLASDRIIAPPLPVGDQVFVGTADNMILALDARTGDLRWRFDTEHSIWAQPTYQEGVLFVGSLDKTLYALSADTGGELWRATLDGAIAGKPIVGEGLVYVGSFGRQLHAVDVASGVEVWSAMARDWVWAAPTLANGVLYYADIGGNVFAVDAQTGAQRWETQVSGPVRAEPVVVNDIVYVASSLTVNGNAGSQTGALTALEAADGRQRWQNQTLDPIFTTPVVVGENVVVATHGQSPLLLVFDLENGSQQWQFALAATR